MKFKNKLIALVSTAMLCTCLNVSAAEVMVFTDSKHPISNQGVAAVFVLDDWQRIEGKLSEDLPNDEETATKIALERIKSPEGRLILEQLVGAQKGVLLTWQMGIMKIPAIVVDGKYVVYGVADVEVAVDLVSRYLARETSNPTTDRDLVLPKHQLPTR